MMHFARKPAPSGRASPLLSLLATALLVTTTAGAALAQAPTPPVQTAQAERDERDEDARGGREGREMRERDDRREERRGGMRERGPHHGEGRGYHHGRHHGGPGMGGFSSLEIAETLAAVETGIGIRSDQLDTWRTFTGALVAFSEASRPGWRPRRDRDATVMMPGAGGRGGAAEIPAAPGGDATQPGAGARPPAGAGSLTGNADPSADGPAAADDRLPLPALNRLERMADRAIEAGERARALKTAIADLASVLTPEQVETAREMLRPIMREWREERRDMRRDRREMRRGEMGGPRGRRDGPRGERQERGERRDRSDAAEDRSSAPDRT